MGAAGTVCSNTDNTNFLDMVAVINVNSNQSFTTAVLTADNLHTLASAVILQCRRVSLLQLLKCTDRLIRANHKHIFAYKNEL